jgi:hypothetical protein
MSKKLSGLGQGAATGAGLGASIGSIVGPWGTAIGGAAGAIGGGLYGYLSAEDEEDPEAQRQAMEQEVQRAKEDAWEQFMLASAPKASTALKNRAQLERAYDSIDQRGENNLAMFEAQRAAQEQQENAQALTGLARAGTTVGNRFYNAAKAPTPPTAADASSFAPMPSARVQDYQPADLSNIPAPVYTPSSIQDPSLSPEVQAEFDAENLKPLRRGARVGF